MHFVLHRERDFPTLLSLNISRKSLFSPRLDLKELWFVTNFCVNKISARVALACITMAWTVELVSLLVHAFARLVIFYFLETKNLHVSLKVQLVTISTCFLQSAWPFQAEILTLVMSKSLLKKGTISFPFIRMICVTR